MWQRIQTLYLAIATALMVAMIFSVKAVMPGADPEAIKYSAYLPYLILLIIISLLDFLALTSYKFRVFQMRTAVLAAIITLALQVWLVADWFATKDVMIFKLTSIFPIICVILDILAARGILSDQMMVESFSRLRSGKPRKSRKK